MNSLISFNFVMNRKFVAFILLVLLAITNTSSFAVSNRVVAVINNDVVTENELNTRLERIRTKPSKAEAARYGRFETEDELRYQVLKSLVEESVLVQRARQLGINVSSDEIDNTMQALYQSMGIDPALESNKLSIASLRKEVESELLVSRLVRATLARNINVSPFEVDEVLNTQANSGLDKEYEILQLFVRLTGNESDDLKQALRVKVDGWREALAKGVSMEDLAEENSSGEVVPVSRNLGWKASQQLPELFLSQLDKMQRGDTSEVIASPNAFHVLQLSDVRGGAKVVEKRSAQHILISAKTELERQQAIEKLISVRDAVLVGEDFTEFASRLSDDPGSAAKGGDLGWISPGDTVPEFERVLFSLKIGEVSQPVATTFGVHILKLNKIEKEDVSNQAQRNQIAEQIRRRKTGQQYSAWLSDLVSKAYIDYF